MNFTVVFAVFVILYAVLGEVESRKYRTYLQVPRKSVVAALLSFFLFIHYK